MQRMERPIQFRWTRGHQGLEGNTQADQLARQGAELPYTAPYGIASLAYTAKKAKEWLKQEESTEWVRDAPATYKLLGIPPAPKGGPKELTLPRSILARLVAARSGHGDFYEYHQRMGHSNFLERCSCGRRKKANHFFYCRRARRKYGHPPGPKERVSLTYYLGDPKGAVFFGRWLETTKFYEEICPNWTGGDSHHRPRRAGEETGIEEHQEQEEAEGANTALPAALEVA